MSNTISEELKSACILVVDDEPTNVKLLERMLEASGFENLLCTQDPRQVLGLLQDNDVDLILLDINMPHMDGFQVMDKLKAIKKKDDYLPILIITGELDQEMRHRALRSGAKDFLRAVTRCRSSIM